jgi:hypothetical protein
VWLVESKLVDHHDLDSSSLRDSADCSAFFFSPRDRSFS